MELVTAVLVRPTMEDEMLWKHQMTYSKKIHRWKDQP
jgi:hypothetical protein